MSATHLGVPRPDLAGALHPNWRGDDVGYRATHNRARKALAGLPCAHADDTCKGRMEVAFDHATPGEFRRVGVGGFAGKVFSTRPEDYIPLCQSHHMRYDHQATA